MKKQSNSIPGPTGRRLGALLFALLLVPLAVHNALYDMANLPKSALAHIITAVMGLVLFYSSGAVVLPIHRRLAPLLALFVLWAWLSILWAHNRYLATTGCLSWVLLLVVFIIASAVARTAQGRNRAMTAMCLVLGLTSLLGCCQYLFRLEWINQIAPPAATFSNKNMAAHLTVMLLPVAVAATFGRNPFAVTAGALSAPLACLYLIYTQTRAAWLAASLSGILMLGIYFCRRHDADSLLRFSRNRKAGWLAAVLFVLIMANATPEGFVWRGAAIAGRLASYTHFQTDRNIYGRFQIWHDTLKMIADHPLLGVGFNNFGVHFPAYWRDAEVKMDHSHNDYLQMTADLGLPGGLLFIVLLGAAFSLGLRTALRSSFPEVRLLAWGTCPGILAFGVMACFCFPATRAVPPMLLVILIALLAACDEQRLIFCTWERTRLPQPLRGITRVAVPLLAFCLVLFEIQNLRSNHWLHRSIIAGMQGQWGQAVAAGRRSAELNPWRRDIHFYLAGALFQNRQPRESREHLLDYLQGFPDDEDAHLHLARVATGLGEMSDAKKAYEEVIRIKPNRAEGHLGLAQIIVRQGDLEQACQVLKRAKAQNASDPRIWLQSGILLHRQGAFVRSAFDLRQALSLDPALIEARSLLEKIEAEAIKSARP